MNGLAAGSGGCGGVWRGADEGCGTRGAERADERLEGEAHLLARTARQHHAIAREEERVRLPRRRGVHALPVQRYHTLRRVAQGQVTEAQLPAVVAAPGEDLAVAPDGDDVRGVAARRHEGEAHPAEPHQPVRALKVGQLV